MATSEENPETNTSAEGTTDEQDESENGEETTITREASRRGRSNENEENRPASFFQVEENDRTRHSLFDGLLDRDPEATQATPETNEQAVSTLDNEVAPNSEQIVAEDTLTEAESQEVTVAIIESRSEELREELAAANEHSPEQLEVLADAAFLDSLRSRLDSGEDMTMSSVDAAFTETVEDLSLQNESNPEDEVPDGNPAAQDSPEENVPAEDHQEQPEVQAVNNPPSPPSSTPPSGQPPSSPTPPHSSHGGSLPPYGPQPPGSGVPPLGPLNPGGGGYNFYPPPPGVPGLNQNQPLSPNHNQPVIIENIYINRRRRGRDMLIGGIVGYVIGRRGGRKRTEKRLMPEIKKLEKEVGTLHDVITEREEKIRKLARRAAQKEAYAIADSTVALVERRSHRHETKVRIERQLELQGRASVERLGKLNVLTTGVFLEKRLMDGKENDPKRKPVESMVPAELIAMIPNLKIDDTLVADYFASGRLSEAALREIVKNYLRKGPYEQVFWRELRRDESFIEAKREQLTQVRQQSRSATGVTTVHEIVSAAPSATTRKANPTTRTADYGTNVPARKSSKIKVFAPIGLGVLIALIVLYLRTRT